MSYDELLNKIRNADIVSHDQITLRSGEISDYYVDVKQTYGNAILLTGLAKAIVKILNPKTSCIAASGYGGIPLAVVASGLSGLPLTLVREADKNHGKKGLIIGYKSIPNDCVALLDDVFTTGSSLLATSQAILDLGANIIGCYVIVDRSKAQDFKFPITSLFKIEDLIT